MHTYKHMHMQSHLDEVNDRCEHVEDGTLKVSQGVLEVSWGNPVEHQQGDRDEPTGGGGGWACRQQAEQQR